MSHDQNLLSEPVVARPLPVSTHRVCNGAKLGNKRREVEALLLEGQPKQRVARILNISPHVVRAVAKQMDTPGYAALSEQIALPATKGAAAPSGVSIPDLLRSKALQSVDAISEEKLRKASPSACAIVADRLLGRAESIEGRTNSLDALATIAGAFGISSSHSVSRVTLEQKVTVESSTKHQPAGGGGVGHL